MRPSRPRSLLPAPHYLLAYGIFTGIRRAETASKDRRTMAERQFRTLTKRTVDRLSVNGKDAIFWDRDLPGFGVRVYPSDKKVGSVAKSGYLVTCLCDLPRAVEA